MGATRRLSLSKAAKERRYQLFAAEFLRTNNATAAGRAAGLRTNGAQFLKNHPELVAYIDKLRQEAAEAVDLSVQAVKEDLRAAHEFDPRQMFRADGTFKHPSELTLEQARQLEAFEVEEEYRMVGRGKKRRTELVRVLVTKVKFSKRLAVRDQGMRYHGLYKKDNEQRAGTPGEHATKVREALREMERLTGGKP